MLMFLLRRVGAGLVLLFVIASATFFLLNLAGQDPARQVLGPVATAAQVDAKRAELGLDQPVLARYGEWLLSALRGDLGVSWFSNQPVTVLLGQALPATLSIVLGSVLVTALVGTLIGASAAVRGGIIDRGLQLVSTFVQAIPNFLVALILAFLFAVQLRVFPATGFTSFASSPSGWAASIVLPVIALAVGSIAAVALQVRGSMIDVLRLDYIRTLRGRGLPTGSVLFRHALRNAAPPSLTTLSLMFIVAISGSVVVEKVFNIPGIGTSANIAASRGDLPIVLGVVIVTVVLVVLVNLLVDLAQGWLNPKVRVS